MSPTQRTLAKLRAEGYLAAVVEKWNTHAHIRQDLFGIADVLAVRVNGGPGSCVLSQYESEPWGETLLVQCCSDNGGGVAERVAKIKAHENTRKLLNAEWRIQVWGWGKRGAKGKRKLWTCRVVEIT